MTDINKDFQNWLMCGMTKEEFLQSVKDNKDSEFHRKAVKVSKEFDRAFACRASLPIPTKREK